MRSVQTFCWWFCFAPSFIFLGTSFSLLVPRLFFLVDIRFVSNSSLTFFWTSIFLFLVPSLFFLVGSSIDYLPSLCRHVMSLRQHLCYRGFLNLSKNSICSTLEFSFSPLSLSWIFTRDRLFSSKHNCISSKTIVRVLPTKSSLDDSS